MTQIYTRRWFRKIKNMNFPVKILSTECSYFKFQMELEKKLISGKKINFVNTISEL